jgi:UDP-glucuronate decarboxylase
VTLPLYVEVDEIYNLACPASPVHYQFDPVQTTKTSVHGAINMLGLAKRVKAKILQASTSEVYGDPTSIRRSRDLLGPRQSDRASALATTRASAAPRRCSWTTGASTAAHQGGPHLQHLWPAHASERRARGVELHLIQALKGEDITSMATATRPARSAMSTTWSTA